MTQPQEFTYSRPTMLLILRETQRPQGFQQKITIKLKAGQPSAGVLPFAIIVFSNSMASLSPNTAVRTLCTEPTTVTWQHLAAQETSSGSWATCKTVTAACTPHDLQECSTCHLRNAGCMRLSDKSLFKHCIKTNFNCGNLLDQFPKKDNFGSDRWAILFQPNPTLSQSIF